MHTSTRTLVIVVGVLLATAVLMPMWMWMPSAMGGMMGAPGQTDAFPWHGWMGGMGFGWITMLGFWALLALGIVAFLRLAAAGGQGHQSGEAALDVAKRRYAAGEISRETYEQIRNDIERR